MANHKQLTDICRHKSSADRAPNSVSSNLLMHQQLIYLTEFSVYSVCVILYRHVCD